MSKLKNNIVILDNKQKNLGLSAKITPISSHLFQADVEVEPKLTNLIYNVKVLHFLVFFHLIHESPIHKTYEHYYYEQSYFVEGFHYIIANI